MTERGAGWAASGSGDSSPTRRLWRTGRGASLKLLRALRGKGALVWPGGEIAATYEVDVFARGAMHTVSGRVQGNLSALTGRGDVRLRLRDGREIEIELASPGRSAAEFDARHPFSLLGEKVAAKRSDEGSRRRLGSDFRRRQLVATPLDQPRKTRKSRTRSRPSQPSRPTAPLPVFRVFRVSLKRRHKGLPANRHVLRDPSSDPLRGHLLPQAGEGPRR
jgi:hypothetical protein